jgi:hypothetical protein
MEQSKQSDGLELNEATMEGICKWMAERSYGISDEIAKWMIARSYAVNNATTAPELLQELERQAMMRAQDTR